jgi:hypothetical protein
MTFEKWIETFRLTTEEYIDISLPKIGWQIGNSRKNFPLLPSSQRKEGRS